MAGRRLSPDEVALWRRVAGSVRAMRPVAAAPPAAGVRSPEPVEPKATEGQRRLARQAQDYRGGTSQNTLDGTWDKKIGTGQLVPDRTIDLHGHNLAAAHHRLDRGLDEAIRDGVRVILLITGRPPATGMSRLDMPRRGIIRESIGDWLAASPHRSAIAAVRNAHPRHGGAGALYIVLRRVR